MGVPSSAISCEFVPYEAAVGKLLRGEADAMIASVLPPQERPSVATERAFSSAITCTPSTASLAR